MGVGVRRQRMKTSPVHMPLRARACIDVACWTHGRARGRCAPCRPAHPSLRTSCARTQLVCVTAGRCSRALFTLTPWPPSRSSAGPCICGHAVGMHVSWHSRWADRGDWEDAVGWTACGGCSCTRMWPQRASDCFRTRHCLRTPGGKGGVGHLGPWTAAANQPPLPRAETFSSRKKRVWESVREGRWGQTEVACAPGRERDASEGEGGGRKESGAVAEAVGRRFLAM